MYKIISLRTPKPLPHPSNSAARMKTPDWDLVLKHADANIIQYKKDLMSIETSAQPSAQATTLLITNIKLQIAYLDASEKDSDEIDEKHEQLEALLQKAEKNAIKQALMEEIAQTTSMKAKGLGLMRLKTKGKTLQAHLTACFKLFTDDTNTTVSRTVKQDAATEVMADFIQRESPEKTVSKLMQVKALVESQQKESDLISSLFLDLMLQKVTAKVNDQEASEIKLNSTLITEKLSPFIDNPDNKFILQDSLHEMFGEILEIGDAELTKNMLTAMKETTRSLTNPVDKIKLQQLKNCIELCEMDKSLVSFFDKNKKNQLLEELKSVADANITAMASLLGDDNKIIQELEMLKKVDIEPMKEMFKTARKSLETYKAEVASFKDAITTIHGKITAANKKESFKTIEKAFSSLKLHKRLVATYNDTVSKCYKTAAEQITEIDTDSNKTKEYLSERAEDARISTFGAEMATHFSEDRTPNLNIGIFSSKETNTSVNLEININGPMPSSYDRNTTSVSSLAKTTGTDTKSQDIPATLRSATFGAFKMTKTAFLEMTISEKKAYLTDVGTQLKEMLKTKTFTIENLQAALNIDTENAASVKLLSQLFAGKIEDTFVPSQDFSSENVDILFGDASKSKTTKKAPNRLELMVSMCRANHTLTTMADDPKLSTASTIKLARCGMIRAQEAPLVHLAGAEELPQLTCETLLQELFDGKTVAGKTVSYVYINVPQNKGSAIEANNDTIKAIFDSGITQITELTAGKTLDTETAEAYRILLDMKGKNLETDGSTGLVSNLISKNNISSLPIHLYNFIMDKLGYTIMHHCKSGMDRTSMAQAEWRVMKTNNYTLADILYLHSPKPKDPAELAKWNFTRKRHGQRVLMQLMQVDSKIQLNSRGLSASKKNIFSTAFSHQDLWQTAVGGKSAAA